MQTRWHKHSHVWASCDRRSPPPRLLLSTRPHAGSTTSSEGVVGIELLCAFIRINAARTGAFLSALCSNASQHLIRMATTNDEVDEPSPVPPCRWRSRGAGRPSQCGPLGGACIVGSTEHALRGCAMRAGVHRRAVPRPSRCLKPSGTGVAEITRCAQPTSWECEKPQRSVQSGSALSSSYNPRPATIPNQRRPQHLQT